MLAAILACQLMVVLDGTVMYTALPSIQAAFRATRAELSWVQNAYLLSFGGFMLLGARTGDIVGHRRVFLYANALFVAASVAGGLAQSVQWLYVARGLQGVAGAFAAPSALALLMLLFPHGAARARAVNLYAAVSGAGSAAGLVLGGLLTDLASWHWVLFINVPIGAVLFAVLCAASLATGARGPRDVKRVTGHAGRFDVLGALCVTLGMSLLVYGLVRLTPDGASHPRVTGSLIAAALLTAAFVPIESRARQPLTPLSLFASRQRAGAYACKVLLIGGMLGTFFFLTQYVQQILRFGALQAGLAFLPLSVAQCLTVMIGVPRLMPRVGVKRLLAGGLSIAACGMAWLATVAAGEPRFFDLALPIVMLGIGTGAALVPLTAAGIDGVASRDAGAASGLINAAHYVGGAVGTAVLVCIVDLVHRHSTIDGVLHHHSFEAHGNTDAGQALAVSATASTMFFVAALLIALATMRGPGRTQNRSRQKQPDV